MVGSSSRASAPSCEKSWICPCQYIVETSYSLWCSNKNGWTFKQYNSKQSNIVIYAGIVNKFNSWNLAYFDRKCFCGLDFKIMMHYSTVAIIFYQIITISISDYFHITTRMHSSRMRTVRPRSGRLLGGCLPRRICPGGCLPRGVCPGGVCLGGLCPGGVSAAQGGVCLGGVCPWTESLTGVKTLPRRNYVADGKNACSNKVKAYSAMNWPGGATISLYNLTSLLIYVYPRSVHGELYNRVFP